MLPILAEEMVYFAFGAFFILVLGLDWLVFS